MTAEAKQACTCFLEAVGNGTVLDAPFSNESLASPWIKRTIANFIDKASCGPSTAAFRELRLL
jgi:hypothetical protein